MAFNRYEQYQNRMKFMFEGGDLCLGIRSKKTVADDWCCFDNFKLSFTGVTQVIDDTSFLNNPLGVKDGTLYDLQGRKVSNLATDYSNLPQGIYIQNGRKLVK